MTERADARWIDEGLRAAGVEARRLVVDSRLVQPGDTFVAMPGGRVDGRQYIGAAIARGAASVIFETEGFSWDAGWRVPHWGVGGLAAQAGAIAHRLYGRPSERMWMAAVTGTNGKTSCSQWLAQCLDRIGERCAVIGTLGNGFLDRLAPTLNTTPDVVTLHTLLNDFQTSGAACVAMEASSHGLAGHRLDGVHIDCALFTNLTRDHLDFHGDMESYGAAKARLFAWEGLGHAVLNADDPFSERLAEVAGANGTRVLTYGIGAGDVRATGLRLSAAGAVFTAETPWGVARVETRLLGRFNVSNLLAVLAALLVKGLELAEAAALLEQIEAAPGRMQALAAPGCPVVVIDYAHTPDALEKALSTLRDIKPDHGRLVCVFGCGGDRDAGKRPLMGQVAAALADRVVVTTDNPRGEPAERIAAEVLAGTSGRGEVVLDRAAAIADAVRSARPEDIVLVAGKGHETYQEIAGTRLPFSDMAVARAALDAWPARPGSIGRFES